MSAFARAALYPPRGSGGTGLAPPEPVATVSRTSGEFCMAGKVSPIRLRTWVWILAGLFVVCTLPLMAIALVQGTLRYTDAEGNLASLRQLRQTFILPTWLRPSEARPTACWGLTRPMPPNRHGWLRSWRPHASGSTLPCCSWRPCSRMTRACTTSIACWPARSVA
ncbi:hypothetical protein BN1263240047 [Stenotrophomonas thermophila]|nr:hypothetical protein BN1263240047 [Stenotrophomonas maltophilia]